MCNFDDNKVISHLKQSEFSTTSIYNNKSHKQHLRNKINKSSKRSNETLTSAIKQKQWLRAASFWVAGP